MIKKIGIKWQLVVYDIIASIFAIALIFVVGNRTSLFSYILKHFAIIFIPVFVIRLCFNVYGQIWRYGGSQSFMRLAFADFISLIVVIIIECVFHKKDNVLIIDVISIVSISLLISIMMRNAYQYAYRYRNNYACKGKILDLFLRVFAQTKKVNVDEQGYKKKIAIVGAGRVGSSLAEELIGLSTSSYMPCCFIDINKEKIGRRILGLPVIEPDKKIFQVLDGLGVQEVVIAITNITDEWKKNLYDKYSQMGYKVRLYDYSFMQNSSGKRYLRDFDIEELLFRKPVVISNEKTYGYYKDKVVLITGGGGSIGSELCRQIVKMQPKMLIAFDICENGIYDIQQELKILYGDKLNMCVEVGSITSKTCMNRVFETYHPDIVINAAAHKHVPLMEKNCIEAVENNVFGTENLVSLCEQYGVKRFMMVSTDKAVNPTNVMGATKRMCEMIVQSASTYGKVKYSATRFGNVLGSAGSVIPLFKKQIASGGPITITDKRIIRYFMTIPEASQLVLESGAMADNGELFVLDMGQPVKIIDLAKNMIKLSGVSGIEIVERGLRPGEKLYEELLVKTETLSKTDNNLIFIEHDEPISHEEINEKLELLKKACGTQDDNIVREMLKKVVPTYKSPEEVNSKAEQSTEMKIVEVLSTENNKAI